MWNNFLKISFRNLKKHKVFSLINIFGLAISMSVCLLILTLIKDAYQFDKFHPNTDQIYRILTDANRKSGGKESYATSPLPLGQTFSDDFSYADLWVPLVTQRDGTFKLGDNSISTQGLYTTPDFFNLFGFNLARGNISDCLSQPFQVVLTQKTAQKFFVDDNPVGKILEHERLGQFTIAGVLEEFPGKTHLEFDLLISLGTLPILEKTNDQLSKVEDNWNNYYSTYQFVSLNESIKPSQAEEALERIATDRYKDLALETRDESYEFRLQPMQQITPGPILSNNMGRGLPKFLLWFLIALGIIVIASACINYTNLTMARSLVRTKEVGIRKTIGAKSSDVLFQFISESILVSLLALAIALIVVKLTIPLFNQLQFLEFTDVSIVIDIPILIWFILFAIVIGIIAGIMPAIIFSKLRPLEIIQKVQHSSSIKKFSLRKVLVVSQFTVSLVFLILLTVAWKQTNFAIKGNFGFLKETMVNLNLQNEPYNRVNSQLEQLSSVSGISGISHLMGTFMDSKVDVSKAHGSDKIQVRDYFIDHRYLNNFDIKLLAGKAFPDLPNQQQEQFAIVNQKFLNQFQFSAPGEAIGKTIAVEDSLILSIIGVTEDFLYKPLNYELEPILLRYDPSELRYLNIQMDDADINYAIANLEKSWEEVSESKPIDYSFYHESIRNNFANLFDIIWIVAYFGLLGIIIACLGLLGMAIYTAEVKAKEVSIRKIIGASDFNIVTLLSRSFIWILIITCFVGIPISYILSKQILQIFAFRINIELTNFLIPVLLLLIIGLSTIGSQTISATRSNPVDHLNDE